MIFAGDTQHLVLSITKADGTSPTVTVVPLVSVVRLSDSSIIVNAQTMTLLAGSEAVYAYPWNTTGAQDGDYVALVSYASDGITISGRFLQSLRLGDSRVTGVVALDSTVAKDATVAKDSSVAHFTDLATIAPDNSILVQAIKIKTDNLPFDPASLSILSPAVQNIQDLHDYQMGSWTIDKTVNPQTLTILSPAGTLVAKFQLTDSSTATNRAPAA
jgi:hypothetical protein